MRCRKCDYRKIEERFDSYYCPRCRYIGVKTWAKICYPLGVFLLLLLLLLQSGCTGKEQYRAYRLAVEAQEKTKQSGFLLLAAKEKTKQIKMKMDSAERIAIMNDSATYGSSGNTEVAAIFEMGKVAAAYAPDRTGEIMEGFLNVQTIPFPQSEFSQGMAAVTDFAPWLFGAWMGQVAGNVAESAVSNAGQRITNSGTMSGSANQTNTGITGNYNDYYNRDSSSTTDIVEIDQSQDDHSDHSTTTLPSVSEPPPMLQR